MIIPLHGKRELLHFFREVNKLKHIKRKGWVLRNIAEPESVADHSYMTALISMFLSDQEGLDTEKVIKMALLHDIQEAMVGDITPVDAEYEDKDEIERQAINEMLADYPEYIKLWKEFNAMASPEAKLVCDADKIEMFEEHTVPHTVWGTSGSPHHRRKDTAFRQEWEEAMASSNMLLQAEEYEKMGNDVSDFWDNTCNLSEKCMELYKLIGKKKY